MSHSLSSSNPDYLSPYIHDELALADYPYTANTQWFVGIDLAPNKKLESGLVVLDKNKTLFQADKVISDRQILRIVEALGNPKQTIVAIDCPKSLSLPNKFAQERVRMYPNQLKHAPVVEGRPYAHKEVLRTDRCSDRAWSLFDDLNAMGVTTILYFNVIAKQQYDIKIPFRTRSPQGCRALQAAIQDKLKLDGMVNNIFPSAVLDAMVAAYSAWVLAYGEPVKDYRLFLDEAQRLLFEPMERV